MIYTYTQVLGAVFQLKTGRFGQQLTTVQLSLRLHHCLPAEYTMRLVS